jgi:uroporphyrinogen decarboxylase
MNGAQARSAQEEVILMNSRERVLKALALQKSDRVPVVPFIITFAAKYAGFKVIEYSKDPDILAKSQIAMARRFKVDAVYVDSDPVIEIEAMGAEIRYPEDESPMASGPIVKASSDIKSLKTPDPEKDGRLPVWLNAIRMLKEEVGNEFGVFANLNAPFQATAQLLGITETCTYLYRNPGFVRELLDLTTKVIVSFMKAEIQAGADAIVLGDAISSPTVISPRHFEQFSFPYIQRVIREAGGKVPFILHICGDATPIIDKMVETGTKYLEVDSYVDLAEVRRKHGNSVGIIGNVSPNLLLTGSPEAIERSCHKAIEAAGLAGAYILGSGCEVPKNTPHANLDAMVKAAEKYGRYL